MDLFHSISQSIDKVLTCHWLDELKNFKMPETKMMDTEPGGEQTQYESIKTQTVPSAKASGQLAGDSEHSGQQESVSKERGEQTAANIRYGQAISEQGVGGKTTTSTGEAQQGGYGGVKADEGEDNAAASRKTQGYGGGSGVGA